MKLRTTTVTIRGEVFTVRELRAVDLDALGGVDDREKGLRVIALSLVDREGRPRFAEESIEDACSMIELWPLPVVEQLADVASKLNGWTSEGNASRATGS